MQWARSRSRAGDNGANQGGSDWARPGGVIDDKRGGKRQKAWIALRFSFSVDPRLSLKIGLLLAGWLASINVTEATLQQQYCQLLSSIW
jgi:hypothetical protein